MTVLQGGYVGAKSCTGGPQVGNKTLTAFHLEVNGGRGGTNLGIYNCRAVRGGTTTSLHGEGRASDLGTPTSNTWSWGFAEFLRLYSAELGIQCIIHNRKIWSSSGGLGWRAYSGVAAHFDHLHVELTWAAARGGLTLARLRELYARHIGQGASQPDSGARAGDGVLERGDKGDAVGVLQRVMKRWYPSALGYVDVDEDFGPDTERAVRYVQDRLGLKVDGVAGPQTLGKLGLAYLR